MLMMMAAESISEERKRPDLLVLKPSAVLSRLGLLEAVEASRHCVVDAQIVAVEVSSGIKRSCGRKIVLAPCRARRLACTLTAPSLATPCLAAPCLSHRSGARLLARPLVTHFRGTTLAPAATSLRCKLLEEIEPKLTETSISRDALTLSIVQSSGQGELVCAFALTNAVLCMLTVH